MSRFHFRRGKVNVHVRPKREVFKAEGSVSQVGLKYKRVCPNCGHYEFSVVSSFLPSLFGQKSKCKRCGFIFKKAWTEKEYQTRGKFERNRR